MEEEVFIARKKKTIGLIHKIYLIQLKTKRNYTACTKTKSEVRGGGRKPWRQKGTGQARAGSSRSPLWVGGGVSFGPKPRVVSKKSNKKERRLATFSAFYLKKKDFLFIEDNFLENFNLPKTKLLIKKLENLKIDLSKKTLLILPVQNNTIRLATKNIQNLTVTTSDNLSLDSLLNSACIILSKNSFNLVNKHYGKL